MKQKGRINGYRSAMWSGVSSVTLAMAAERAIKEELTGLYHLVKQQIHQQIPFAGAV
jgi:dTDP-4-dehydrorhamnose reductase